MTPPCTGQHALFDSTDPDMHEQARQLCAGCPMIAACEDRVRTLLSKSRYGGNPEGTWAGKLYHGQSNAVRQTAAMIRRQRIAAEDARFDDLEMRRAHHAYTQGERTEWARTGHRVYQRRNKAKKKAAA